MKSILRTDLVIFFNSAMGYVIISVWLLALSSLLWIFPGSYNLPDGGYATLLPFFSITPFLLLLFVPAVTMRLFTEEKRLGTLELLLSRPVSFYSIVLSKYFVGCIVMLLALIPTLVFPVSLEYMSVSGLDTGEVFSGYLGIIAVILAFSATGVFASSLTSNQLVAFLLAAFFSFSLYFGFDLLASLYSEGGVHNFIAGLGMKPHYDTLVKGVVDTRDVVYFLSVIVLFLFLTVLIYTYKKNRRFYGREVIVIAVILLLNLLSSFWYARFDFTKEKRYTLSLQSRMLLEELDAPLEVILYLNGGLNPAFDRLRSSTIALLEEFSQYTVHDIVLKRANPAVAVDERRRQENYLRMEQNGMQGVTVNERDRDGRVLSRVIFPWAELVYKGDTVAVSLLQRNISLSSMETLNVSIDELEYNLTDGIRVLQIGNPASIAFIEGHGELEEPYVYEAMELLSRYYQVDRGGISGNPQELFPYRVLIIAGSRFPFSEIEKFALDQYVMNGGSLFFLVDGVRISEDEFNEVGESPTLKSESNLDDLLFTYGVRINPVTVMDMNCTFIRLASSQIGTRDSYVTVPWYFAPLLETTSHVIGRNISPLKSELVSTITWVGEDALQKSVLLTSSSNAQLLPTPEKVSLRYVEMPADPNFFNQSYLPVAGLIEGRFTSAFRNRAIPADAHVPVDYTRIAEGKPARIIVAASSSLIKNEWRGQGGQATPLPIGFDAVTGEQLGNPDFIVNAVNYLAGNEQWLHLRSRTNKVRLLSKQEITVEILKWQLVNVLLPLLIVGIGGGLFIFLRRRKYGQPYLKSV